MQHLAMYTTIIISLAILSGCSNQKLYEQNVSNKSTKELIKMLEDQSDPENLFGAITEELGKRGVDASDAAPALSVALTYPRRDSYLAGFALLALGPNAKSAIPILVSELTHERTTVRKYAALSLGAIGREAECAIPQLASLLWHPDSETRSAAAISIDAITEANLVDPDAKLDPQTPGIMALDEPEGIVSGLAKEWWLETGQDIYWPIENCKPPN
jgi:HEAT repeat protein